MLHQSKPKPTPTPTTSPTPSPCSYANTHRSQRSSPSGGNAKGTNTGMKPMNLETAGILAGRGIADVTKFQSTALPDTAAGDYQHMKGYTDIDAFSLEHTAGKTGKYLEGFTGDRSDPTAMHAYAVNQGYKPNSTREIPSETQKGSSNTADTADQSRSIPVAPANHRNMVRGMGLEDDERFSNFGNDYGEYQNDPSQEQIDLENRNIRARTAFLDQNLDSVKAARASNAELGRYRDNGKYYANVGGKGQEITREGFNSLATNPNAAANLKDHYVKQIQANASDSNSANPQADGNPGGEIATVDVPGIGAVEQTVLGHNHHNVDSITAQINNAAGQVQDTAGGLAQNMLDKTKSSTLRLVLIRHLLNNYNIFRSS